MRLQVSTFLLCIGLVCLVTNLATGQSESTNSTLKGRVLEVNFGDARPVGKIALTEDGPNGFWASGFPRLENSQSVHEKNAIQALKIMATMTGPKCEVVMTAMKGKRFGEIEELVARYSLSIGESVTISEMSRLGFKPTVLKLVDAGPSMASLPIVENPSRTLWVSVTPIESTLPSYGLVFRNDSSKGILAIAYRSETNGRPLLLALPQGRYGMPLIPPGAEFTATQKTNGFFNIMVVIEAVIYEDGTVEGDGPRGQSFLGYQRGRKAALLRIMPMLRSASSIEGKLDLAELVNRIDDDVTVSKSYPNGGSGISTAERVAFEGVTKDVIAAVRKLGSDSIDLPIADVRRIFADFVKLNQEWLDRLSK